MSINKKTNNDNAYIYKQVREIMDTRTIRKQKRLMMTRL